MSLKSLQANFPVIWKNLSTLQWLFMPILSSILISKLELRMLFSLEDPLKLVISSDWCTYFSPCICSNCNDCIFVIVLFYRLSADTCMCMYYWYVVSLLQHMSGMIRVCVCVCVCVCITGCSTCQALRIHSTNLVSDASNITPCAL